jgi:hypothetical protein
MVMLGLAATSAAAQAGAPAKAASPPAQNAGEADGKATAPPAAGQPRVAPSGCPYRDGKLELIV